MELPVIPYVEQQDDAQATPIWPVAQADYDDWLAAHPGADADWLGRIEFKPEAGKFALLPGADGELAGVILGLGETPDMWAYGGLSTALPTGRYRIDGSLDGAAATGAGIAWALGSYRFGRYRDAGEARASLCLPDGADGAAVGRVVKGTFLARDLINTPASDLGPEELAEAALALAGEAGGQGEVIVGDDLLARNYPAIHAVGRASDRAPRLVDFSWGEADAPKLTLVGKGVCFDSGGLDLKPASGMLKMKKDMGGAAAVLGLASMVMAAALPVRLRVLIPAVENAVSGTAYRPGDILDTRKGLTVEVGNTDAEGRIVLCDALAEAAGESPALIVDLATLTGAARVALGPDLPAYFTDGDSLSHALLRCARAEADPLWRLPLYDPYAERLKSKVADLNNVSDGPFAGAVTAALFLKAFVPEPENWLHIDTYGWNDKDRPGRPAGGEALAIRALYAMIAERFNP
jgi:leucyl aminopeptidase